MSVPLLSAFPLRLTTSASTRSPSCSCLANNDAPTGAAHITMEATLAADWEGWSGATAAKKRGMQTTPRAIKVGHGFQPRPLWSPSTVGKLDCLSKWQRAAH